jgi:hypothetical protein
VPCSLIAVIQCKCSLLIRGFPWVSEVESRSGVVKVVLHIGHSSFITKD